MLYLNNIGEKLRLQFTEHSLYSNVIVGIIGRDTLLIYKKIESACPGYYFHNFTVILVYQLHLTHFIFIDNCQNTTVLHFRLGNIFDIRHQYTPFSLEFTTSIASLTLLVAFHRVPHYKQQINRIIYYKVCKWLIGFRKHHQLLLFLRGKEYTFL